MKEDKSRYSADGKLKRGDFREYFKDDVLASVGKYKNGKKWANGGFTTPKVS